MPTLESRLCGALWGQFIGDAAALGTHWVYDLNVLAERYPEGIEGFEPPRAGHYHEGKVSGDLTHYGDVALLLLESLAGCGEFREQDFGMRLEGHFNSPLCKSYKDKATRGTLEHLLAKPGDYQNGADDDQMGTVTRVAPLLVAYYQRSPEELFDAAHRLTLVTQNHPTAQACVRAHLVLLRELIAGKPFREAFEATRKSAEVSCDGSDYFEFAHMLREMDVVNATGRFGQSCPLPQSFPSALHAAWVYHDDFALAVLNTICAGGDNAGRAGMVGAWMGAVHGMEGIPAVWFEKLRCKEPVQKALNQILKRLQPLDE